MSLRIAAALTAMMLAAPAAAQTLKPEEARLFVAGKFFAYTCFEGTRGAGRIFADGSVAGTIQLRGNGPVHHVRLPPNTLRVEQGSICASVQGLPFSPCFNVVKTSNYSFRGSLVGLGFAYCDFERPGRRVYIARKRTPTPAGEPLALRTAVNP
jgi:hypothetical protein